MSPTASSNTASVQNAAVSLSEIAALVEKDLSPWPARAKTDNWHQDISAWLAGAAKGAATSRHSRIALFELGGEGSSDRLGPYQKGSAPLMSVAKAADTDVQVYELAGAMTGESAIAHAMSYGMMAVQPGLGLLVVGATQNNDSDALLKDFNGLCATGRADVAAIIGALIAARLAKVPVIIDGSAAAAAARLLENLNPQASAHIRDALDVMPQMADVPLLARAAVLVPFIKALYQLPAACAHH